MEIYDLAIAYKWIYDRELVEDIESYFQSNGLTTYIIHLGNYLEVENLLREHRLRFSFYLDRASDEDEKFEAIANILNRRKTRIINPYKIVDRCVDKSKMHKILKDNNIPIPETVILPPIEKDRSILDNSLISYLGIPFVVKPAYYSGGSEGVYINAKTIEDIQKAREENPDDSYLIQKRIFPMYLRNERLWFRIYWFFNEAEVVWWNDQTHLYRQVKLDEYQYLKLYVCEEIVKKIAQICQMDYFSTEITINNDGNFFVIDYVNDQCDFRKKTSHFDGIPDKIVQKFIHKLFEFVKKY
jgi:hypothetical protein